jgi:hypothetical protein
LTKFGHLSRSGRAPQGSQRTQCPGLANRFTGHNATLTLQHSTPAGNLTASAACHGQGGGLYTDEAAVAYVDAQIQIKKDKATTSDDDTSAP